MRERIPHRMAGDHDQAVERRVHLGDDEQAGSEGDRGEQVRIHGRTGTPDVSLSICGQGWSLSNVPPRCEIAMPVLTHFFKELKQLSG